MNLTTRMTLAIGACAIALSGGAGLIQLNREEMELRRVAEREAVLLGRSLQVAFENAIRDRQIEDVAETLQALSRVDSTVVVHVFGESGSPLGASRNVLPTPETLGVQAAARELAEPLIQFVPDDDPELLRVGLRLQQEAPLGAAAIVLEKPLAELQRDLSGTRRGIAASTVLFVVIVAASTWLLTKRYVGQPLHRLVSNMRLVRGGNLQILPTASSADEVGETQREFELLVQDLRAERLRADQEFEARRRMERGLQEADKLLTLGQLSAVMAHEIGSPLQILEGRARALEKHAEDAAATRRTAGMLVAQAERITRIVRQLLSIARRRHPVRSEVNAVQLVEGVAALLELEARRRDVALEIRRAGAVKVTADGDQLQQVALNLMRNALEASSPGGRVSVTLGGDEAHFVLEVSDSGSGVSPEARPHLFEPFFTTKAASGGSGLGLSAVRSIARDHGGHVEFLELDAPGCRVRVTLPRQGAVTAS